MKVMQAYKFKLIPKPAQERKLRQVVGCCRWTYNKALELQIARYENGEKKLSYPELCKALTSWRSQEGSKFLSDAPTHPLQQSLKDLERAYSNFFAKRADFPKFKKKGTKSSFRYPDPKQIKLDEQNKRIYLPKIHKKIADTRLDFQHKFSTTVSKSHAVIVIEDLQVSNMSRSAAGTIEQPGSNVRAKSGLNTSILDQAWYEARRQLEYKQKWRGGTVIAVPAHHTSQRCADCDYVNPDNRISQSDFRCLECGNSANADLNAARNILAAGRAVIACGEIATGQLDEARTHRVSSSTAA
jgi:IS605 OrfB family transposase